MPLYELEQLLDLVKLRLAVNFLEIQELRDSWVHEDVVAPAYAAEAEPERLGERTGLGEPEIVRGRQRLLEKLSGVHVLEGNASTRERGSSQASSLVAIPAGHLFPADVHGLVTREGTGASSATAAVTRLLEEAGRRVG